MSRMCRAFSAAKLRPTDREAFYAEWRAAMNQQKTTPPNAQPEVARNTGSRGQVNTQSPPDDSAVCPT